MYHIEADKHFKLDTRQGWKYYGEILYAQTSAWASRPQLTSCGISKYTQYGRMIGEFATKFPIDSYLHLSYCTMYVLGNTTGCSLRLLAGHWASSEPCHQIPQSNSYMLIILHNVQDVYWGFVGACTNGPFRQIVRSQLAILILYVHSMFFVGDIESWYLVK